MTVARINCPACAAPVDVVADNAYTRCPFCRSTLRLEHEKAGADDELVAHIAKETSSTRSEIRRMQLMQELSALKARLATLQGEIRSLEREKATGVIRRQLAEVQQERAAVTREIELLAAQIENTVTEVGDIAAPLVDTRPTWQRLFNLLCVPTGRISQAHFVAGFAIVALLSLLISPLLGGGETTPNTETAGGGLLGIVLLFVLYIYGCIAVKRYHDIGKHGGWFFIMFIPFGIFYQWYELLFVAGDDGANAYGIKPSQRVGDLVAPANRPVDPVANESAG